MEYTAIMARQLREVYLNGTWIATNLKAQLADVTFEQATKKIGDLNTIAALAFHINYYVAGVGQALKGGKLEIRDKFSFDLPPLSSEEDWENLKNQMWEDGENFANAVEQLQEEQLSNAFFDEKYGSYYRNIVGIIEHTYYHLGQIALLKKLVTHND
ncbi:MAG: DUF1572 domain-containing protein [Bacteroidota bacterium]